MKTISDFFRSSDKTEDLKYELIYEMACGLRKA